MSLQLRFHCWKRLKKIIGGRAWGRGVGDGGGVGGVEMGGMGVGGCFLPQELQGGHWNTSSFSPS